MGISDFIIALILQEYSGEPSMIPHWDFKQIKMHYNIVTQIKYVIFSVISNYLPETKQSYDTNVIFDLQHTLFLFIVVVRIRCNRLT